MSAALRGARLGGPSAFSAEGYECTDKALEGVPKNFKQANVDDLCAQVGAGNFTARAVVEAALPGIRMKRSFVEKAVPLARHPSSGLIPGMALHFAGCCQARPHRRRRHHRQGGHHSHHRLRDARGVRRYAGVLDRRRLGRYQKRMFVGRFRA